MNYKDVLIIIKDFEQSTLSSLELEMNEIKIKMTKPVRGSSSEEPISLQSQPVSLQSKEPFKSNGHAVKSPLVGTYYSSSNPNFDPFVQVGDQVKRGDTLCIIEAMKIMNEITAPVSGKILAIHAKNGDTIGFEQVLITIEDAK